MADEDKNQRKPSSFVSKLLGPLSLAGATAALLAGAAVPQHALLKPKVELGKAQAQQLMNDSARKTPLLLIAQSEPEKKGTVKKGTTQPSGRNHASHSSHGSHTSHSSHRSSAF